MMTFVVQTGNQGSDPARTVRFVRGVAGAAFAALTGRGGPVDAGGNEDTAFTSLAEAEDYAAAARALGLTTEILCLPRQRSHADKMRAYMRTYRETARMREESRSGALDREAPHGSQARIERGCACPTCELVMGFETRGARYYALHRALNAKHHHGSQARRWMGCACAKCLRAEAERIPVARHRSSLSEVVSARRKVSGM